MQDVKLILGEECFSQRRLLVTVLKCQNETVIWKIGGRWWKSEIVDINRWEDQVSGQTKNWWNINWLWKLGWLES